MHVQDGCTSLTLAAANGHLNAVIILTKNSADAEIKDKVTILINNMR